MTAYTATIRWSRNSAEGFAKGQYSRAHEWAFDGGLIVPAGPSPHIVPDPWGNPAGVDPEDKPEIKKAGGVFYTPTPIVEHIARTQPQRPIIVAHADRTAQDHALRDTVLLGCKTNTAFLRALLTDPDVVAEVQGVSQLQERAHPLLVRIIRDHGRHGFVLIHERAGPAAEA